jgi:hypothetical protein
LGVRRDAELISHHLVRGVVVEHAHHVRWRSRVDGGRGRRSAALALDFLLNAPVKALERWRWRVFGLDIDAGPALVGDGVCCLRRQWRQHTQAQECPRDRRCSHVSLASAAGLCWPSYNTEKMAWETNDE